MGRDWEHFSAITGQRRPPPCWLLSIDKLGACASQSVTDRPMCDCVVFDCELRDGSVNEVSYRLRCLR